jgi:hypothetical protein
MARSSVLAYYQKGRAIKAERFIPTPDVIIRINARGSARTSRTLSTQIFNQRLRADGHVPGGADQGPRRWFSGVSAAW